MQLNTCKPGLNRELDPSDSVCSCRLAWQWLKMMYSSEATAAGFSKTHSSTADGSFFIKYDRTIGVKVSHLICKLCLGSMLWGTHRACLDRITALELELPASTMRQISSHAACGRILSFTNPYLTLTVPWSKVSFQFLPILSMIPVTWLVLTWCVCVCVLKVRGWKGT